ncbi:MAG: DUF3800 domain-containing protein [Candidatus Sumerlaeaceae bacterium]|nr:DUF3800 domain-containing protein [Candidatus Sumerlaeaceae bacterium]
MYLLYVDESGDTGLTNSPSRYFVLSGLVIHELRWQAVLDHLIAFRRRMKGAFALKLREEIHASELIHHPGELARIHKNNRLTILRAHADAIAAAPDTSIINVIVDKDGKPQDYDVFEMAWKVLLHRFHDTIGYRNFAGPRNADERAMIFPDRTDVARLDRLLRKLRKYNQVPHKPGAPYTGASRNAPLTSIIEDPNYRDSVHSYFIQAVDTTAWLLYQHVAPSTYMKKKSAQNYFARLGPVLCRAIAPKDPLGIVRL